MILVPAAVPTDMTTCDLCGNLVTKSNLTLHQLRCSTNVVSAAAHNSSQPLQNSTRPKSTNNDVNRQANSAKQKKKKKEKWEKISHIVKKYLFVFAMSCSSLLDYMWVHNAYTYDCSCAGFNFHPPNIIQNENNYVSAFTLFTYL